MQECRNVGMWKCRYVGLSQFFFVFLRFFFSFSWFYLVFLLFLEYSWLFLFVSYFFLGLFLLFSTYFFNGFQELCISTLCVILLGKYTSTFGYYQCFLTLNDFSYQSTDISFPSSNHSSLPLHHTITVLLITIVKSDLISAIFTFMQKGQGFIQAAFAACPIFFSKHNYQQT